MSDLTGSLPALHRLALSYAPARTRDQTLALFALDARLARIVRSASEPMLAQIRLAWWRDLLKQEADARPAGEPVVALLDRWGEESARLAALADGWEHLVSGAGLEEEDAEAFARGRGEAFAALAAVLGQEEAQEAARRMGQDWALWDLASRLSDPGEADMVRSLLVGRDRKTERLPRVLRPLVVLHGLASAPVRRNAPSDRLSARSLARAIRLGLFGA